MTDDELKAELLQRAKAGLPRPQLDSDNEHERELAEALIRFTTATETLATKRNRYDRN